MARRKHPVVPTDQMVPADPISQELPLGGAGAIVVTNGSLGTQAPTTEDEAKGYWDRARGRTPARPSVTVRPETIRTVSAYNEQGSTGDHAPAVDEANSYWDRARGVAPRWPVSLALLVASPRPAAAVPVTPEPALSSLSVTQGTDAIPAPLMAAEAAPVTTEGLAAAESTVTVRGAHVRKEDAIVAPVLGADVKADDPLADAAWHTRLAEDDALSTTVRDAHVRVEDPLAGEVQAAHEMRAVAATESATQTFAVEPSRAADAQDSAGKAPAKARRRHWGLVAVAGAAAALTAGLGGGGAYAYFTSTGSGTGSGTIGSPANVVLGQATIGLVSSYLVPGGTGDLFVRVNNPDNFAVTITGISQTGNVAVVGSAGCTSDTAWPTTLGNSGVSVPTNAALNITVPANSGSSFTIDIPNAASMTPGSASVCQGATFQIPVTITVRQQ